MKKKIVMILASLAVASAITACGSATSSTSSASSAPAALQLIATHRSFIATAAKTQRILSPTAFFFSRYIKSAPSGGDGAKRDEDKR